MAESAGALGDHHRAVAAGRRAVSASPLNERSHRILFRALHGAGDRAGVVQAYEACREILAEQLGVDPALETIDAYLAAIGSATAGGQWQAVTPGGTGAGAGRAGAAAIVGLLRPGGGGRRARRGDRGSPAS